MSVDERLADWLEQNTPEPPHAVMVADVALRVQRRRRPWQPLLAAACVVLVAAITIIVASRSTKHNAAPPVHQTTHRTPSPHSPKPTVVAPKYDLPIRPWDAHITGTWDGPVELSASGAFLYLTTFTSRHSTIYRLDTHSGSVAVEFQPRGAIVGDVAFGNGRVWIPIMNKHSVHVEGVDPATLDNGEILPAVPVSPDDSVSLATAGAMIYLAVGHRVTEFDAFTRTVVREFPATLHPISAIAVRGDTLYVGSAFGAGGGELYTFSTTTGSLINAAEAAPAAAMAVTAGGLWMATRQSGMSASVNFNGRFVQSGGGGIGPTVGVFGTTAWLGGTGNIQCADAETGRVRAHAATTRGQTSEFITNLVVASGRLFAIAYPVTSKWHVVEMHPPAACR